MLIHRQSSDSTITLSEQQRRELGSMKQYLAVQQWVELRATKCPCVTQRTVCLLLQSTQWKSGGREPAKSGLHMPGRDSVFTSPVSAAKPSTPVSAPQHNTPKEVRDTGKRVR